MATVRKSAFAVYAENKPAEPEIEEKPAKRKVFLPSTTNQKPKSNLNLNGGGVSKKFKGKANAQQEQNKYAKLKPAKLKPAQLNESIGLFNGKQRPVKQIPEPKKKFEKTYVVDTKMPTKKAALSKPTTSKPKYPKKSKASASKVQETQILDEEIFDSDEEIFDSRQKAIKLFKRLIYPMDTKEFFNNYWEKKPLLLKRHQPEFYKGWFSCKEFDEIMKNHPLEFNQNVDVTTYIDGVKEKHEMEGRAYPSLVWDSFQQGCSIRLLNPQTYSKFIWNYLSFLQELFGTFVGANVYLTPSGTQGFAPHYDDIEAFVLQLEGKKRWRVYKPLSKDEVLPRFSSPNFSQEEIGEPIIDTILETGDILYFPRGFIHQANALDDIHSLHITVSCYQKNCWGDFLSKLLPGALEIAMKEDVEFRKGLPINYLMNNGIVFDKDTSEREAFRNKTYKLMQKLAQYAPVDSAVDQMGKGFISDAMPPCLNEREKSHSIHGHGETWNEEKNRVEKIAEFEPDTSIKLIRRNCIRLVVEGSTCLIYYSLDNGRVFQEKEPSYLEVEADSAPAVEFLIKSYPKYVSVEELPIKGLENQISIACCLYDKGLIKTGEPLECMYADDSDEEDDMVEAINADGTSSSGDENDEDDDQEDPAALVDSDGQEDGADDDFNSVDYDNFTEEAGENGEDEEGEEGDDDDENDVDDDEEAEDEEGEDMGSDDQDGQKD